MRLFNWFKFNKSIEDIDSVCRKWNIINYNIHDGLVDVTGDVDFDMRELKYLPIKFGNVEGDFTCVTNKLTTLNGSPQKVSGDFRCSNNKLTDLKGSPKFVRKNFSCSRNLITTLVGGPQEVYGDYHCSSNRLTDLRGFPEVYRGNVYILTNPVYKIIELFENTSRDIVIEILNDYNVIRNGKKVNLQLLKYAFDDLQLEFPNIEYIEGYEII